MEISVDQLLAKIGQLVILLDGANARNAELEARLQACEPPPASAHTQQAVSGTPASAQPLSAGTDAVERL